MRAMLAMVLVGMAAATWAVAADEARPAGADAPAAPAPAKAEPAYAPTADYEVRIIEGWTVRVHKDLVAKHDLAEATLKQLGLQLYNVTRKVPAPAVERLRQVVIWVEENPKVTCMCYHPSRGWLEGNGFNPEKAKSVELGGPSHFLDWTKHQWSMVLHELAHAYHHQVLGYDQPDVRAAYEKAKAAQSYESVLYLTGETKRAYALNNDQEYFAELTEAWFGTNDFYPFVRAEVMKHDPEMAEVLKKVWVERWKTPEPKPAADPAK